MEDIAIKIDNISKYYKLYNNPKDRLKEALSPLRKKYHNEFYALNEISLEIKKGEIFGIIGRNGSGKSTLLKLIAGILTPSSGAIKVNGTISALLELGAGFNPDFSGLENIYFYGTIIGFSKEEMQERLDDILAFADIGTFIHQPLKTYSSGMRARLAFAVATEVNPDILIVDEVLAVGDAVFQRKCFAKMESMLKDGKTVLLVSHSRNSIVSLCDRAVLIENGLNICIGDTNDVVNKYEILCNKNFLNTAQKNSITNMRVSSNENEFADTVTHDREVIYDHSLVTDSIFLKSSNIDFLSFRILDVHKRNVNILKTGNSYFIHAQFEFGEALDNLTFALRVKTQQGVVVTWIGFPFEKGNYIAGEKGESLSIKLQFDCNLLAGTYIIDASLQSIRNNEITQHVGAQDIMMIKIHKVNCNSFGIVDLNFSEA